MIPRPSQSRQRDAFTGAGTGTAAGRSVLPDPRIVPSTSAAMPASATGDMSPLSRPRACVSPRCSAPTLV